MREDVRLRYRLILSLSLLVVLLPYSVFATPLCPIGSLSYEERVKRAADFLYGQFNPDLRLCREAPVAAPNIYWLLSDNLLAQYALRGYYPEVSSAIMGELIDRGYAENGYHEALIGGPIPVPNRVMVALTIVETPEYVIKADVRNECAYFVDWAQYADRLLLHSLSLTWKGDISDAMRYFNEARDLWDGKGVRDPPQAYTTKAGLYETYKLPMLLLASRVLDENLPFQEDLERRLWSQQREDGGIVTHYNVTTLEPVGDANTETTSITIIAHLYKKNHMPDHALFIISGILLAATIMILIIYVIRKRRKSIQTLMRP